MNQMISDLMGQAHSIHGIILRASADDTRDEFTPAEMIKIVGICMQIAAIINKELEVPT